MKPVLVVQQIHTQWGREHTHQSNALNDTVPDTLPLPLDRMERTDPAVLYHIYAPNRLPEEREQIILDPPQSPLHAGCLTITLAENQVHVECRYTRDCGAPPRYWMDRDFNVYPNERLQVVYNGRFSGHTDAWWYEKRVIHVGLFDRLSDSLFTEGKPTYRFAAMSPLY